MRVFKPGELVRIVSLPWATYCDGTAPIGSVVTVARMTDRDCFDVGWWGGARFAVIRELLPEYPHHNIGTKHLRSTGLRVHESRNKREGKYAGKCHDHVRSHLPGSRPSIGWAHDELCDRHLK